MLFRSPCSTGGKYCFGTAPPNTSSANIIGSFDVRASSGSEAEEMVRDRFANEDIKVRDLELDTTEVNATEVD